MAQSTKRVRKASDSKLRKAAKKKGDRIRGGTYEEYYSQDYTYLKQLCKHRGLRYYGKKWGALLLSLCAQGKLSRVGEFAVHFEGTFDDQMDSSDKRIYVVYSDDTDNTAEIDWDKIGESLLNVVRCRPANEAPGRNPYDDLEISDGSDGEDGGRAEHSEEFDDGT